MKKKQSKQSKHTKQNKRSDTKRTARTFAKKSKQRAASKKRSVRSLTRIGADSTGGGIAAGTKGHKDDRQKAKQASIEPAVDMHIDGVLYKIREGRHTVWRIMPNSRRYGFELCPEGTLSASEGELVEAVLTKLPDRHGVAACRITHVFGAADSKRANYEQILTANGIETEFCREAVLEAESAALQPLSAEGREDLRGELILTIDGADAKDLDDAVSLEREGDGYILSVHIADVSHYVKEGGELDREAMSRSTSVYFTDKVVPMLPACLSNGACSLNAGEDKYAFSAHISLDSEGRLRGVSLKKSIIRSSVRGVYSEVNDLLERGEHSDYYEKYRRVWNMLQDMHALYKLRCEIADKRGYIELESAEAQIILDENGDPVDIIKRERGDSERMIEQFMLLANEAVATYMSTRGLPCVYRVHEPPDEEKLQNFAELCSNYKIDATPLRHGNASALTYSHILSAAAEKGIADIISESMLRSFMKAKYSEVRSEHFGLALDHYAHFTSPIRRYPDLAVHRILSWALTHGEEKAKKYARFAREAALRSSDGELRALYAERAIADLYKTLYMKKHENELFSAGIISVQPFGFFCMLENTCEGLVPVASLEGFYSYNEKTATLTSRHNSFAAGDRVTVRVRFADVARHKIEFEYVQTLDPRGTQLLHQASENESLKN